MLVACIGGGGGNEFVIVCIGEGALGRVCCVVFVKSHFVYMYMTRLHKERFVCRMKGRGETGWGGSLVIMTLMYMYAMCVVFMLCV